MNFASSLVQGRTLSAEDQDFVSILLKELDRFQCGAPKDRALMFEPLHGFQRYLIHKVTESFPRLTSFSINDEKGKRTVVCFKNNKKKDQNAQYQIEPIHQQQQQPGATGTTADMQTPTDFHQRGRKPMSSRTPGGSYPASAVSGSGGSRYRESARSSTKNNDSRASTAPRPLRRPTEASSRGSSRPRTLREKPHQGARSLSSHSSPVRHHTMDNRQHRGGDKHMLDDDVVGGYDDVDGAMSGTEKYHTDRSGGGGRKRNSRQSEEDGSGDRRRGRASCPSSPRRSSRRAPSGKRGKSRDTSLGRTTAVDSGYDRRSEASLDRRMRGLNLEGKVVNGDNDASDGVTDDDDDDDDNDHRHTATTHKKDYVTPPPVTSSANRRRSSSCRKSATTTRSRARSPPSPPPPVRSATMKATKSSSSSSRHREPSVTKSNGKPSSMKHKPSTKKQEEVVYSSSNDDVSDGVSEESDDESLHGEEPPSYDSIGRSSLSKARRNLERIKRTSSDRQQRAESSSSGGGARRKVPEARKPSRSQSVPRKSRDVASGSTRNAGTQYEHSKPEHHEVKNKRSSSVKVNKSKDRGGRSKKAIKEKALSNDTLLDGSNTTVYMGLPVDKESDTTPSKHRSSSKSRRRESDKSKSSSSKSKSVEVESDHHHHHHRQRASTPPPSFTPAATSDIPTTTDGGDLEQPPSGHENDLSPDMLLAFREFLQQQAAQQQQQQAATSTAPTAAAATTIPAELAHQLYLSYLSAYYAGATGVWPPPAPPAYIMPQHARGGNNNAAQQFPFFQSSPYPNNFMMPPPMEEQNKGGQQQQSSSGYYPFLPTNFGGGSDHDPYQSHSSLNNPPPTNPTAPSAPNAPSSGGEDYAPSPAAYQHDGAAPHVRRYSLERACQSDSCKSSACDDDQPLNNSSSTSHQHSGTPVTSNAGGSMSDASCNSTTTRSSEVAVSSNSRGNVVVYVRSRANSSDSRRSAAGGSTGFSAPEDTVPSSASPAPSDKKSVRRSKSKQLQQRAESSSASSSTPTAAVVVKSSPTSMDKKRGEALLHQDHHLPLHNSQVVTHHPTRKSSQSSSSSSSNCVVTLHPTPLPLPPADHPTVLKHRHHHHRHHHRHDSIPHHGSNNSLHERTNAATTAVLSANLPAASSNIIHANTPATTASLHHHVVVDSATADIDSLPPPPDVSETASCGFSHEDLRMSTRHAPLAMMDDDATTTTTTTTTDDRLSHISGSGSHVSIIDLVGNLPPAMLKKGCPRHESLSDTDDEEVVGDREVAGSSSDDQGSDLPPPPLQLLTPEVCLKSPVFEARISTDGSDQEAAAGSSSNVKVVQPPNYEEALSTTCSRDGFDDDDDKADDEVGGSRLTSVASTTSGGHRLLQPPPARTTSLGSVETNPTTTEESSTPVSSPSGNGSTGNGSDGDAAPSSNRNNDIAANAANIVKQDEKYDYYNWDPKKDKWQEERFRRFVEVYGFSPDMTDHQLAEQMRVFRGLRMNRIGHQHALCLLPTVEDAEKMLEHNFRCFHVRPLASATTKSKEKAERKLDDKDRGRSSTLSLSSNTSRMTNASVANRMILNSLGRRSTLPSSQQQGSRGTAISRAAPASNVDEK